MEANYKINTQNPATEHASGGSLIQLNKLNTTNEQTILYQTEELQFTILGGIKLDGLDRLRVTLKIEVVNRKFKHYLNNPDIADLALRQNLDLY